MFPSPFGYVRPTSLDAVLDLLATEGDDATLLAGGQSLIPLMKLRLAAPALVVDIGRVAALAGIRVDGGDLAIGARTRLCDVVRSPLVREHCPALAEVTALVGDPQVRHRGTVGGSIAHADPASDLPSLLLALDGSVVATSRRDTRTIAGTDLFHGFWTTDLAPDELLTEVRIPLRARSWAYEKFTRRAQEWAIVGAAAIRDDDDGCVRVALTNAAATPVRAAHVEAALRDGQSVEAAAAQVVADISPSGDAVASRDYRRLLAVELVSRALSSMRPGVRS